MATLLAEHMRKAAHGRHHCGWCGDRIAKGERYTDQRVADYGTVWTWREHPACFERIRRWWSGLGMGGVEEIEFPYEAWQEMLADERARSEQGEQ